jgi:hypothetical protein
MIQNATAWGPVGHKIVAQIAEDQLTLNAKKAVDKLIPEQTLAAVSNWADSIKSDPDWVHTKTWHFVSIPDDETYESSEHEPAGDIITSIKEMVSVLKSRSASAINKQHALMFIVHLVGDIHQPLHVGRPSDRGGNEIKVLFEGRSMNLHSLWDSGMISKQNMDYLEYARYLQGHSLVSSNFENSDIPLDLIIEEDMSVRKQIYIFSAKAGPIVLDQGYYARNFSTMNSRLLMGGKRLADLLNKIFI